MFVTLQWPHSKVEVQPECSGIVHTPFKMIKIAVIGILGVPH